MKKHKNINVPIICYDVFRKYIKIVVNTIIAIWFFSCSIVYSETFFVRPSGAIYGTGDGLSYENAWSGFSSIKWDNDGGDDSSIDAGDTLSICGVHDTQLLIPISGLTDNLITIRGDYPNERGIIRRSKSSGIRFDNKNYISFIGITFENSSVGIESYNGCNNISILNCSFINLSLKGVHLYSSDPDSYVENILIKNCEFNNIGEWGNTGANSLTYAGYSRSTITEDSIFKGDGYSKGVDGILIQNIVGNGSNHIIRRCTFSGHQENCVDLKAVVQSPLLEGPTQIYENDFSNSNELELVFHWGTQGVIISRNYFHDGNLAIGVVRHDDINNKNGNLIITYNVFARFGSSILMDGYAEGIGSNVFVNNTCYHSGDMSNSNYSIQINTNHWKIYNNIFYLLSIAKSPFCSIRFYPNVDMNTIEIDNNCHFLFQGQLAYRLPDDSLKNVSQVESNGLQIDPDFIDPTNSIFSLKSSSLCAMHGVPVAGVHPTLDMSGTVVNANNPIDIGAYSMNSISKPKNLKIID